MSFLNILPKILPGTFLGWGLGANDASNIFGTAVANNIIKFYHAAILASIFVIVGSFLEGPKTFDTVGGLAAITKGDLTAITLGAAVSVAFFTYLKLPISTSQALVGSILGIGIVKGSDIDLKILFKIVLCWITTPLGAFIIGFILYAFIKWIFSKFNFGVLFYSIFIKVGILLAGIMGSYSLGANNVGNVTGIYAVHMKIANLPFGLSSDRFWALLGGISIAIGIMTYSKRVMETVGKKITNMLPMMALISVVAQSITVYIYTNVGVPVSTSQAIVGAVAGVGAVHGFSSVNFKSIGRIAIGWMMTPIAAGAVAIGTYFLFKLF